MKATLFPSGPFAALCALCLILASLVRAEMAPPRQDAALAFALAGGVAGASLCLDGDGDPPRRERCGCPVCTQPATDAWLAPQIDPVSAPLCAALRIGPARQQRVAGRSLHRPRARAPPTPAV